jgi:hypothetical protein
MRTMIFCMGLLGLSVSAFANDGSTPYIKVKQVQADLHFGDKMEFGGGDADKIYNILPRDYVYDVSRSLNITSKRGSVRISCTQEPKNSSDYGLTGGIPSTTKCTITFDKAFDPASGEGDSYEWAPSCKEQ